MCKKWLILNRIISIRQLYLKPFKLCANKWWILNRNISIISINQPVSKITLNSPIHTIIQINCRYFYLQHRKKKEKKKICSWQSICSLGIRTQIITIYITSLPTPLEDYSGIKVGNFDVKSILICPRPNFGKKNIRLCRASLLSGRELQFKILDFISAWISITSAGGVTVKAMDCWIVVSEFELQSRYYVHFQTNILGKGINSLIFPAMG